MKSYLFFFLFALAPVATSAQAILTDTVEWKSSAYLNAEVDTAYSSVECVLTTFGQSKIVWREIRQLKKGAVENMRYVFTYIESKGEWTSLATDGKIDFLLENETWQGSLSIKKSGSTTTLHLLLHNAEGRTTQRDSEVYTINKK